MNKELYIKREKSLKELRELSFLVNSLQAFLIENEKNFKRKKSIEALIKIKTYYEVKKKEYQEIEKEDKKIYKELCSTCAHEVAIKRINTPYYYCLICKNVIEWDIDKVPEKSLISIDTTKDNQVYYIIEKIFKEVLYSDKDLIETISNTIEEIQYDRNIKVYRRSR